MCVCVCFCASISICESVYSFVTVLKVLRELDNIKNKPDIGRKAHRASQWLESQRDRIHFESWNEFVAAADTVAPVPSSSLSNSPFPSFLSFSSLWCDVWFSIELPLDVSLCLCFFAGLPNL